MLLVLIGHAFVASATHFHRVRQFGHEATAHARVGQPEGAQDAPPASGHEQCLLCRLQRNLVSDLQHTLPALGAPRAEVLSHDHSLDASVRQARRLAPSGRGPPHA